MTLAGFTGRNNWPGRLRQHGRSDLCRVPGENQFGLALVCPILGRSTHMIWHLVGPSLRYVPVSSGLD